MSLLSLRVVLLVSLCCLAEGLSAFSIRASSARNIPLRRQHEGSTLCVPPAFVDLPSFTSFRAGNIPLIVLPNAVESSRISAWRQDAHALASLSFGAAAGIASDDPRSSSNSIRSGVHQVWLQSPGCPLQHHLVGLIDARKDLFRFIDSLRASLDDAQFRCLPPELLELSYLLYNKNGAAYAKHIDTLADDSTSYDYVRSVSFLLYLGDGDNDESLDWDCHRDGGALRIHGEVFAKASGQNVITDDKTGASWSDITPHPGTVVLFDSATVPHQVVATKRSRACVVGWLGAYKQNDTSQLLV